MKFLLETVSFILLMLFILATCNPDQFGRMAGEIKGGYTRTIEAGEK